MPRRDSEDKVGIIAWGAVFVVVGRPVLASQMNAPANAFGVLSALSVVIFAGQIRLQQIALSHLLRRVATTGIARHFPMKQSGIRVSIGSVELLERGLIHGETLRKNPPSSSVSAVASAVADNVISYWDYIEKAKESFEKGLITQEEYEDLKQTWLKKLKDT